MTVDRTVAEPIVKGMAGLKERLEALNRDHFPDHVYAKRAFVIATGLVEPAYFDPTEGNVLRAATALQHAKEVFDAVDVLTRTGSLAGIQCPLEQLETDYVTDFPESSLASKIREGPHYVSF